jgi:hypothetical protein
MSVQTQVYGELPLGPTFPEKGLSLVQQELQFSTVRFSGLPQPQLSWFPALEFYQAGGVEIYTNPWWAIPGS